MSIYHLSVKTISRSEGRSAVAAAAYRTATALIDERTGQEYDYRRKQGVLSAFLLCPDSVFATSSELWNAAEAAESRKNSTVAREYEVALPHELSLEAQEELALDFTAWLVERYQVAAEIAIHAPGRRGDNRNVHAHITTTTRLIGFGGFGAKTRVLDNRKTGRQEILTIREQWEEYCNLALRLHNCPERIDHRSYAVRGLDIEPTKHLGPVATGIERRAGGAVPVTHRGREHASILGRRSLCRRAITAFYDAKELMRHTRQLPPLKRPVINNGPDDEITPDAERGSCTHVRGGDAWQKECMPSRRLKPVSELNPEPDYEAAAEDNPDDIDYGLAM
ncbi:MobQ family relaxase [Acetobacter musti]|nr:MobQ family relaxase [Acetobacter musti]